MTIFIYLVIFFMEIKKKVIINAWIKLFWKFWARRTSIDQIVTEANVAKGTFYLYFKNKEDLYTKIIDNTFKYWEEVLKEILWKETNIKEKLLTKMMISLKFFEKDDIMRNIIFWNKDYQLW